MYKRNYTTNELDAMANSDKWQLRLKAAEQGHSLNTLLNDENASVRMVAKHYVINSLFTN